MMDTAETVYISSLALLKVINNYGDTYIAFVRTQNVK